MHDAPGADIVVVANHTEADGVGLGLMTTQQLPSLRFISVCADPADSEWLAKKIGLEREIVGGRSHRDADDVFHVERSPR